MTYLRHPGLLTLCLCSAAATAQTTASTAEPTADAARAALLDERSVLTPRGTLVIEPSIQYSHSSTTNVALEGYTVIPTVVVGLINVSELQRDTLTSALAFRYGLTQRLEVDLRIPYVYKQETVREREIFDGSPTDLIRDSDGHGLGDVELSLRYQFNRSGPGPYWLGGLRVKSRTGEGPFETDREQLVVVEDDQTEVVIGEVFAEQPTGTGFWAVQPSISFVLPSDPAVIFGNLSYTANLERDLGEPYYSVDPGDVVGFGFGLGFAFNSRTSFSLGYDHSVVLETTREADPGLEASFDRFQVGSLLFGLSQRLSAATSLSVSLAVGATRFAPDMQLGIRLPVSI